MNKEEFYQGLCAQLQALLDEEHDVIANLANASALLYMNLEEINWAGFYLYKDSDLILGPFQGKPACMHIALGKGVCGTCAETKKVQCVRDVHAFPGHIACDAASRSEIVIPVFQDDDFLGVLDLDAPILNRFDEEDAQGLQAFVKILENSIKKNA